MRRFVLVAVFVLSFLSLVKVVSAAPVCDARCQTDPSCCANIVKKAQEMGEDIYDADDGDQPYHECEWPERGYCKPSTTCNKLPDGIKYRGHCGWYWAFHDANGGDLGTNTPNGYGCMIGDSEATMRPICGGGGTNPTPTTPPGNPTPTTPPGGGGSGTVIIKVHLDSAGGALYNDTDKDVPVYIEGPAPNGRRFGELLKIPGSNKGSCTSRGGFPFSCSAGTAQWKGADGKSGTSAGGYNAMINDPPQGWEVKIGSKNGTLSAGGTLTLDLAVSKTSGGPTATPTATPPPGATATPTPTPTTAQTGTGGFTTQPSHVVQTIHDIFFPSGSTSPQQTSPQEGTQTVFPQLPSVLQVPPVVASAFETADLNAPRILDVFSTVFGQIGQLDQQLENTVNGAFRSILR